MPYHPAPWNQNAVRNNALSNGPFMVNVVKAGKYKITPMRWPEEADKPAGCMLAMLEVQLPESGYVGVESLGQVAEEAPNSFEIELPAEKARFTMTLHTEDNKRFGAYYVKIEYLGEDE
ncbi:MAG: hypothetical protein AAF085_17800 [Planctomycetota bacterium]